MTAKALGELTDKQLEAEWTKAAKEHDKLKKQLRDFSQEHQRRAAAARARETLAGLTDTDRAMLLQEAKSMGIESEEDVKGTRN